MQKNSSKKTSPKDMDKPSKRKKTSTKMNSTSKKKAAPRKEGKKVKSIKAIDNPPSFDDSMEHRYRVKVYIGPNNVNLMAFSLNPKNLAHRGHLTYDDVLFEALDEMERRYPRSYYPKSDLDGDILVEGPNGEYFPVVSEGDNEAISRLKKSKEHSMFLILPDATYSLTPEYEMYEKMVKSGVLDPQKDGFDYDEMRRVVQIIHEVEG
jgi:hypothetical protein